MANWQYKLIVNDFYHSDGLTIEHMAHQMAKRLEPIRQRMLKSRNESVVECAQELEEVVGLFRNFEGSEINKETDLPMGDDTKEFDSIMYELYNIADTKLDSKWNGKKLLWIEA